MRIEAAARTGAYIVNEPCTVEVGLRADEALEPGAVIEFQFPQTWEMWLGPSFTRAFQTEDPAAPHYIGADAGGPRFSVAISQRHLNCPEGWVRHGRLFTATLEEGTVPPGHEVTLRYANTVAPFVVDTDSVWLRVNGVESQVPAVLRTVGGPHARFRVLAPSFAAPGEPFEVRIVSLDGLDNASSTAHRGLRLELDDGACVAEALAFTGVVTVPVTVDAPGVRRFRLGDTVSNAVRVEAGQQGPYWGDIHIHTKVSMDGQGEDPYPYAREVSGLDFAATTDHIQSTGDAGRAFIERWAEDAYEPGRFVTLLADERNPPAWKGHHNLYFRSLEAFTRNWRQVLDAADGTSWPPDSVWQSVNDLSPDEAMIIPHHTGIAFGQHTGPATVQGIDLAAVDDRGMRPVTEIYSHHGQSEYYAPQHALAYEFNRMRRPERRTNVSAPGPYYAQDYWKSGRRIGVIASSDEHSGQGGRSKGGIAAVFMPELTRESLFDALRARRSYGTTGERILLDFEVNGTPMGQELRVTKGEPLTVSMRVWATEPLVRIEILRYRFGVDDDFIQFSPALPSPNELDAEYTLEEKADGPVMYYARVTQFPLEWPSMAWSSPVWVDVA